MKSCEALQQVVLGTQTLHASHAVWYQTGILICPQCLAFGTTAPRKLLNACQGRPQHFPKYQREVWARVSAGLSPRDSVTWPRADERAGWQLLRPGATLTAAAETLNAESGRG